LAPHDQRTNPKVKAANAQGNIAGHLLTLHERPLVAPVDGALWPDRDALRWHREQCLWH